MTTKTSTFDYYALFFRTSKNKYWQDTFELYMYSTVNSIESDGWITGFALCIKDKDCWIIEEHNVKEKEYELFLRCLHYFLKTKIRFSKYKLILEDSALFQIIEGVDNIEIEDYCDDGEIEFIVKNGAFIDQILSTFYFGFSHDGRFTSNLSAMVRNHKKFFGKLTQKDKVLFMDKIYKFLKERGK